MGAYRGADILLSRPPQELILSWKKNCEYLHKIVKIKKLDLFLHILPDSNQNRAENTAKNIEISIFFNIQNGVSVKLSNVMTSQQCQRGAQRFREQKDQRNDQSRPLCVLRLIKSLNLVIVN